MKRRALLGLTLSLGIARVGAIAQNRNSKLDGVTAAPFTLYAGTLAGIFKSINEGASWTAVNTGLTSTRRFNEHKNFGSGY
jgi:hypothetical protein